MRKLATVLVVALVIGSMSNTIFADQDGGEKENKTMKLGNFSISLAVKDINKSRAFYEKLGFEVIGGQVEQNWLILQNETTTVGLFQGMFEENLMTFNPGWDHKQQTPEDFLDVREIQKQLEKSGVAIKTKADPDSTGPASLVIADPDGNTILFDQHVPAPGEGK
jgi:catechol 2,3-dioxygenase-like lactoylglutathione lyase family enzyme